MHLLIAAVTAVTAGTMKYYKHQKGFILSHSVLLYITSVYLYVHTY
jgi:hypothetical protein